MKKLITFLTLICLAVFVVGCAEKPSSSPVANPGGGVDKSVEGSGTTSSEEAAAEEEAAAKKAADEAAAKKAVEEKDAAAEKKGDE